jgi:hypothetical protein
VRGAPLGYAHRSVRKRRGDADLQSANAGRASAHLRCRCRNTCAGPETDTRGSWNRMRRFGLGLSFLEPAVDPVIPTCSVLEGSDDFARGYDEQHGARQRWQQRAYRMPSGCPRLRSCSRLTRICVDLVGAMVHEHVLCIEKRLCENGSKVQRAGVDARAALQCMSRSTNKTGEIQTLGTLTRERLLFALS